jgi:hypothetical protein
LWSKTVCFSSFLKSFGIDVFVPIRTNHFLFLFSSILTFFLISWFVLIRSLKVLR